MGFWGFGVLGTAARALIDSPKLQALLQWIDQVTAGCEASESPVAQRSFALACARSLACAHSLALARSLDLEDALARDRTLARALVLARTLDLDLARALDRALDFALNRDRARALTLDLDLSLNRALALTLDFARAIDRKKFFLAADWPRLIARLKEFRTRIPSNDQPRSARMAFIEQVCQTWYDALRVEPQWLELSEEEVDSLADYLSATLLIVRCKEAAVRMSKRQWQNIEQRLLIVESPEQTKNFWQGFTLPWN